MWQRKVAINIIEPFGQEEKKVREAQGGGGAERKRVQEQDKLEWCEERERKEGSAENAEAVLSARTRGGSR